MDHQTGQEAANDSSQRTRDSQAPPPSSPPPRSDSSSYTLVDPQQPHQPQQKLPHVSPHKRRGSEGLVAANDGPASTGKLPSGNNSNHGSTGNSPLSAKRARPEAKAPKILPERYEHCDVEDMVVLIASMLCELIETNDPRALQSGHLTRFHSRTAPGISVLDYLLRLAKHATLTPPLLLAMVYYIDRLCTMYAEFTINTLTVHRFLITAATVAAKGLSDSFWNNSTYARVGGIRVAELKMLELEFLYRLDWKIVPYPEVLEAYYRPLVERCPGYALASLLAEDEEEGGSSDEDDVDKEEEDEDGYVAVKGEDEDNIFSLSSGDGDVLMAVNPRGVGRGTEGSSSSSRGQTGDAPNTLHPNSAVSRHSGRASASKKGHTRQSSTNLIGEDMVASGGLTGPAGR